MIIQTIKYLMAVTLGLLLGYWLFQNGNIDKPTTGTDKLKPQLTMSSKAIPQTDAKPEDSSIEEQNNLLWMQISGLNETIKLQAKQIDELESSLEESEKAQQALLAKMQPEQQQLQTMSMDDFENQIQDQFMDRFKGVAIELKGEQLADIKKEFNRNLEKAEWNANYENKINEFIQNGDDKGYHFVDELTCNRRMCRLTVNSAETDDWQSLYLSMTEQPWFRSMTLTEDSGLPNRLIYYITEPNPLDK